MRDHSRVLRLIAIGAALGCFAYTLQGLAEETTAEATAVEPIEEIITTGSRIKRSDFDGPQPIMVFDRVYLESTGFRDVTDFSR